MIKRKRRKIDDAEGDLMPMIDVIFLLIIFFVLITEITQAELEEMILPEADMAEPDAAPPPGRLVVNIVKANERDPNDRSGRIIISRRPYDINSQELREFLKQRADKDPTTGESLRGEDGISDLKLLIRCDRRVEFQYFQTLMALLANPTSEILVWQVQIAISREEIRTPLN